MILKSHTFLKSRRAWMRWSKSEREQGPRVSEPEKFPCFGFWTVADWGMEWSQENYLYAEDIHTMSIQFFNARPNFENTSASFCCGGQS